MDTPLGDSAPSKLEKVRKRIKTHRCTMGINYKCIMTACLSKQLGRAHALLRGLVYEHVYLIIQTIIWIKEDKLLSIHSKYGLLRTLTNPP